ncbi:MAG: RNA-binding cell elongation regulator Jag/EloR [Bacilli bacterium]|jgi:spoIIIJ-associated protein
MLYSYEAQNKEEAINKALNDLNTTRENLLIQSIEEIKGIVKKKVTIKVLKFDEVVKFIKDTLYDIAKYIGIDINLEVRKREDQITIKMFSDNNNILIGKGGRTLMALQTYIKQLLYNTTQEKISFVLDVENYKEKRIKGIEYLAKKIAKEVANTKVDVTLDSMNSYERRIVHEALSKDRYVYTESIGEEPNRCVVIKYKETK